MYRSFVCYFLVDICSIPFTFSEITIQVYRNEKTGTKNGAISENILHWFFDSPFLSVSLLSLSQKDFGIKFF